MNKDQDSTIVIKTGAWIKWSQLDGDFVGVVADDSVDIVKAVGVLFADGCTSPSSVNAPVTPCAPANPHEIERVQKLYKKLMGMTDDVEEHLWQKDAVAIRDQAIESLRKQVAGLKEDLLGVLEMLTRYIQEAVNDSH